MAGLHSRAFLPDRAHHARGSIASVSWLFRRSRANTSGQVRESTVREVHQAIAHFEQQRSQLRLSCRTFMIDLVTQSREPKRDSSSDSNAVTSAPVHRSPLRLLKPRNARYDAFAGFYGSGGLRRSRLVSKYTDRLIRARVAAAMAPAHQYQPPSVTAATTKPAASTTSVMARPSRHHRGNPELTL